MGYKPGDLYYNQFTVSNISGVAANADSTPIVILVRNGIDDLTQKVFITNVNVGRYTISGTIPSTYAKGNTVGVAISGTVNGLISASYINLGILDTMYVSDIIGANGITVSVTGVANANVQFVSGVPVNPGFSGSFMSDMRYINGNSVLTYDGIAQTGSTNYIRLASTESSIDNYYQYRYIEIVGGQGRGQISAISSYSGSNKNAYVYPLFKTSPDITSQYAFQGYSIPTMISGSLDSIPIENGLNLRQAISLIGSMCAGSSTVNGNNISYFAINNNSITRISANAVSGVRNFIAVSPPQ